MVTITHDDDPTPEVATALARVRKALPGGEERPGQLAMAQAVAEALVTGTHLAVQAGTGTGKTYAYLIPALLSGRRVVVATATRALQEQLVQRDLPFLCQVLDVDVRAALLKGRSNYLCRAALADATGGPTQGSLVPEARLDGLSDVVEWVAGTESGDRSDLPLALPDRSWNKLSVSSAECPGAHRCPHGEVCFAEAARAAATEADVVVVNLHLYGLHLASGGAVLPEHDVVVIDEAHALEDVAADTLGLTVGPSRLAALASSCRSLFTADHPALRGLEGSAARLGSVLGASGGASEGGRVDPRTGDLATALVGAAEAVAGAAAAARELDVGGDADSRRERLLQLATTLGSELRAAADPAEGQVAWVERGPAAPSLRLASPDVGPVLAERLFATATVILTSATLAVAGSFEPLARRLGLDRLDEGDWTGVDVGSPFDHEHQGLLYCAAHLPEPRAEGYEPAMLDELEQLVTAAGGRTLALFTSRRAMEAAAEHLAPRLPFEVLVQDMLPRPVLHEAFLTDETSVLLATLGFWQGFDAPGPTCSLVVIDRLPFARPDDPLVTARREAATKARRSAFATVDLPAAALLLAQGAGRLLRTAEDRGVIAVLDRRLATASYRWDLVRSLPPFRRTKDPAEARRVLAEIAANRQDRGS